MLMPIKWDSRLSVGNINIDIEHKLIISLINALETVLRHPDEKDSLRFFIDQLYEFAEDHFAHEEKLQIKYMFPYFEENKAGHQYLMAELTVIRNIIHDFAGKRITTEQEAKETSAKVNHLMRNWFVEHIIKSDMKMKGFMDNAGF